MLNELTYNVECSRLRVIDLMVAVDCVIFSMKDEINDAFTADTRREICENAIAHRWQPLKDLLKEQLEAQDAKHPIE